MRLVHQDPVVFQGGVVSLLFGSLGRISLGVASPVFMFGFELVARPHLASRFTLLTCLFGDYSPSLCVGSIGFASVIKQHESLFREEKSESPPSLSNTHGA